MSSRRMIVLPPPLPPRVDDAVLAKLGIPTPETPCEEPWHISCYPTLEIREALRFSCCPALSLVAEALRARLGLHREGPKLSPTGLLAYNRLVHLKRSKARDLRLKCMCPPTGGPVPVCEQHGGLELPTAGPATPSSPDTPKKTSRITLSLICFPCRRWAWTCLRATWRTPATGCRRWRCGGWTAAAAVAGPASRGGTCASARTTRCTR